MSTERFKSYPAYNDSGVEWLGEIPAQVWDSYCSGATFRALKCSDASASATRCSLQCRTKEQLRGEFSRSPRLRVRRLEPRGSAEERGRGAGAAPRRMAEEGIEIPPATTLDRIMSDRENLDGVPFLVEVPDREVRAVRVNITLPAGVLEEVDAHAEKRGNNRSAFLTMAAQNQIHARVVLRKEEVHKLERELRRDEPSRRQQILTLLRKWRHEPGVTKEPGR